MHNIIIFIVIFTVVVLQLRFFIENYRAIKLYKNSLKQVGDLELEVNEILNNEIEEVDNYHNDSFEEEDFEQVSYEVEEVDDADSYQDEDIIDLKTYTENKTIFLSDDESENEDTLPF